MLAHRQQWCHDKRGDQEADPQSREDPHRAAPGVPADRGTPGAPGDQEAGQDEEPVHRKDTDAGLLVEEAEAEVALAEPEGPAVREHHADGEEQPDQADGVVPAGVPVGERTLPGRRYAVHRSRTHGTSTRQPSAPGEVGTSTRDWAGWVRHRVTATARRSRQLGPSVRQESPR